MTAGRIKPATRLGLYEIVEFIGAGGMGEVHKARDTRLNRFVAIKTLPFAILDNALTMRGPRLGFPSGSALTIVHIAALDPLGRWRRLQDWRQSRAVRRGLSKPDSGGSYAVANGLLGFGRCL